MNGIELLLLDLVQMAETPLYPAYRWLGRQLGRDLSLAEFLRLVDRLVGDDVLRLWSIDAASQERSRLNAVPEHLEERYRQFDALDDSFDPFVLSLTPGSAAEPRIEPDWEVDFDFDRETFRLEAKPERVEVALQKLAVLFPDVELVTTGSRPIAPDRLDISGSIRVVEESGG